MSAIIDLIHATKIFGKKTIVDDLSFQVFAGEVFGLLGPNGAGKTTTIRMMVGLMRPSLGDILIDGYSIVHDFKRAIAKIGAVVENPEFYGFLSGYQNLLHFARMVPGISQRRILEVAHVMGLAERLYDPVKIYSLGMRQRLGIAQAMLHHPRVLIFDEPTNGLDPMGIKELREYLRMLAKNEGVTVIVSSHLLSEMELLCDRVAIIKEGRLLEERDLGKISQTHTVEIWVEPPEEAEALIRARCFSGFIGREKSILKFEMEREKIPEIVSILVHGGIKIYGIRPIERRLEEVFMEVTGE